jgi:hypothetical protein
MRSVYFSTNLDGFFKTIHKLLENHPMNIPSKFDAFAPWFQRRILKTDNTFLTPFGPLL